MHLLLLFLSFPRWRRVLSLACLLGGLAASPSSLLGGLTAAQALRLQRKVEAQRPLQHLPPPPQQQQQHVVVPRALLRVSPHEGDYEDDDDDVVVAAGVKAPPSMSSVYFPVASSSLPLSLSSSSSSSLSLSLSSLSFPSSSSTSSILPPPGSASSSSSSSSSASPSGPPFPSATALQQPEDFEVVLSPNGNDAPPRQHPVALQSTATPAGGQSAVRNLPVAAAAPLVAVASHSAAVNPHEPPGDRPADAAAYAPPAPLVNNHHHHHPAGAQQQQQQQHHKLQPSPWPKPHEPSPPTASKSTPALTSAPSQVVVATHHHQQQQRLQPVNTKCRGVATAPGRKHNNDPQLNEDAALVVEYLVGREDRRKNLIRAALVVDGHGPRKLEDFPSPGRIAAAFTINALKASLESHLSDMVHAPLRPPPPPPQALFNDFQVTTTTSTTAAAAAAAAAVNSNNDNGAAALQWRQQQQQPLQSLQLQPLKGGPPGPKAEGTPQQPLQPPPTPAGPLEVDAQQQQQQQQSSPTPGRSRQALLAEVFNKSQASLLAALPVLSRNSGATAAALVFVADGPSLDHGGSLLAANMGDAMSFAFTFRRRLRKQQQPLHTHNHHHHHRHHHHLQILATAAAAASQKERMWTLHSAFLLSREENIRVIEEQKDFVRRARAAGYRPAAIAPSVSLRSKKRRRRRHSCNIFLVFVPASTELFDIAPYEPFRSLKDVRLAIKDASRVVPPDKEYAAYAMLRSTYVTKVSTLREGWAESLQLTSTLGDWAFAPLKKTERGATDVTALRLRRPRDDGGDDESAEWSYWTLSIAASDGLWDAFSAQRRQDADVAWVVLSWLQQQQQRSVAEGGGVLKPEHFNLNALAKFLVQYAREHSSDDITVALMGFPGVEVAWEPRDMYMNGHLVPSASSSSSSSSPSTSSAAVAAAGVNSGVQETRGEGDALGLPAEAFGPLAPKFRLPTVDKHEAAVIRRVQQGLYGIA